MTRTIFLAAGTAAVLLLVAAVWWRGQAVAPHAHHTLPPQAVSSEKIGGAFTLLDETGREVTDADFARHHRLVFFGFTSCPAICPTQLTVIEHALDALGAGVLERLAPLFISVDAMRDTPARMHDYVRRFHPRQRGLTGSAEQIAHAARAFKIHYSKVPLDSASAPAGDPAGDYTMEHTAVVYFIAPDGTLLQYFTRDDSSEAMALAINAAMQHHP